MYKDESPTPPGFGCDPPNTSYEDLESIHLCSDCKKRQRVSGMYGRPRGGLKPKDDDHTDDSYVAFASNTM